VKQDGKFILRDLNSSNGTKVNGQTLVEAQVRNGDRIRFGAVECAFETEMPTRLPGEKQERRHTLFVLVCLALLLVVTLLVLAKHAFSKRSNVAVSTPITQIGKPTPITYQSPVSTATPVSTPTPVSHPTPINPPMKVLRSLNSDNTPKTLYIYDPKWGRWELNPVGYTKDLHYHQIDYDPYVYLGYSGSIDPNGSSIVSKWVAMQEYEFDRFHNILETYRSMAKKYRELSRANSNDMPDGDIWKEIEKITLNVHDDRTRTYSFHAAKGETKLFIDRIDNSVTADAFLSDSEVDALDALFAAYPSFLHDVNEVRHKAKMKADAEARKKENIENQLGNTKEDSEQEFRDSHYGYSKKDLDDAYQESKKDNLIK